MSSSDFSDGEPANTRSSPSRINAAVSNFCDLKKQLVTDICFQGMLKIPEIKGLDRRFTLSLLNKVDTNKKAIRVNDSNYIYITAEDVHDYLDIPLGPNQLFGLEDRSPSQKMDFINFVIGSSSLDIDEKNSLKAAEDNVCADFPDGMTKNQQEQFQVSFVCFCMGNFLLGKYSLNHGIKDFWGSLMKTSEISSYNFCEAVVHEIIESARHVQKETKANRPVKSVSGCILFLQARYLAAVQSGILTIPPDVKPKVQFFTYIIMKQMITGDGLVTKSCRTYDGVGLDNTKVSRNKYIHGKNVIPRSSGDQAMENTFQQISKEKTSAYLSAYTRGDIERKLNGKQIDDLKLHNARMKQFIHKFKDKTLADLESHVFIDNFPTTKSILISNVDCLLSEVLDQVLILSKMLHNHSDVPEGTHLISSSLNNSSKHLSDRFWCGYESSTESGSIKRHKKASFLYGKNLLPELTEVAANSDVDLMTPTKLNTGESLLPQLPELAPSSDVDLMTPTKWKTGNTMNYGTASDFVTPNSNNIIIRTETPSSDDTPLGLDDIVFNSVSNQAVSISDMNLQSVKTENFSNPDHMVQHSSVVPFEEKDEFLQEQNDTIFEETSDIDLNEIPINSDITSSPISKVTLRKGRMARNPWFYGVQRKDVDKKLAESFYEWLTSTKSSCLDSYWIHHSSPRPIKIAGNDFKSVFTRGFNFTKELIDVAVRRFGQMDRHMYGDNVKLRWMHPFESDFATKVLNNEAVLDSRSVRLQLFGRNDDYNICDCRMLVVTNLHEGTWTAYFWDMKEHIVHIIDPTFDTSRADEFHDLHVGIVDKLQAAIEGSLTNAYEGWEIDWNIWKRNYVHPFIPGKKSNETGFLTLLAMRYFNGSKFELAQTEDSLKTFAEELLYNILSLEGNKGLIPDVYIQSIE